MSRAIFVSDIHANLQLPYARLGDHGTTSDRLSDVLDIFEQIRVHSMENRVSHVFILGDLFDVKHPDGPTLVGVSRALANLADSDIQVWILPGNHDAVDKDGALYTLQFYQELKVPGISVLGHESRSDIMEGVTFHAVPWLPEERAAKRIRGIELGDGHNVLLFHQEVAGAVSDSGWKAPEGLDPELFERFDTALTGHYHRAQVHPTYRYLGSPIELRFSDIEAPIGRGFWRVAFKDGKIYHKLVPTRFPKFGQHELRVELGSDVTKMVDIEELAQGLGYLKLVVEGPATAIDANRPALQKWKEAAATLGLRKLLLDFKPEKTARAKLGPASKGSSAISLKDAAKVYVEHSAETGKIAPGDVSSLTHLGVELLEEAERRTKGH
jgi:DNA repair exonuclease SbcCD nuclease subunit